jgi:hypothetical protein
MYILSANEGEPNDDYDDDPEGTISIINVGDYSVRTLDFSGFALQEDELKAKGLRIFGPEASFTQDIEPEYITVSEDSKTAWVTLQENNAMAKVDIESQTILEILPFGFKDYNVPQNQIDVSDKDGGYFPGRWPVYGMYLPDGVAMLTDNGVPYIFTANEGDSRDYDGYSEELRIGELDDDDNIILKLDTNIFPNAEWLQMEENLGRLKITTSMGDTDNDGEYDELYSYGARSFSVWDGNSGEQIFDSRNELDRQANNNGVYRDSRSDDKSIEPEGVVVGNIGNIKLLFVGMERVDAVAVYDVTNPRNPKYLQWLSTNTVGGDLGDAAPEGLLFIPADESPTGTSLLVVSNEASGNVVVYTNNQPL